MARPKESDLISRRVLLQTAALSSLAATVGASGGNRPSGREVVGSKETYALHAKGIRIFPGQWRPHYPWEHIAWVSPSWPSQDYVWLDFPEAIFTRQGLLYLSHVNPSFPVVFPDQPAILWRRVAGGIAFERELPNGVTFGGKIKAAKQAVDLQLFIRNRSDTPLTDIRLQTCFFLRAISEFGAYTAKNKYVHIPDEGWISFDEASEWESQEGRYRLGWRSGRKISDLPVMVTLSSTDDRLIACSWGTSTYSLVCNPNHPCMHADPFFPDLSPGDSATIHGKLIFFEGSLEEFDQALRASPFGLSME